MTISEFTTLSEGFRFFNNDELIFMVWFQKEIRLQQRRRGFHVITIDVVNQLPELTKIKKGILHLFIQHTSASLTINENVSPDVRSDMENHLNEMIPENMTYYDHNSEGSDDMPAHIKSSVLGSSLTIPITDGELNLGTWQGIYLGEHRNYGGNRKIVATMWGNEV